MNERNPPSDSASRFFFCFFHCWTISKRRAGAEWKEVAGARLISSPPGNSLAIGFVVRRRSLERRIHVVLAATAPAIAGQNWRRRFTWAIASVLTGHGFMGDASCVESNPLSWAHSLPPPFLTQTAITRGDRIDYNVAVSYPPSSLPIGLNGYISSYHHLLLSNPPPLIGDGDVTESFFPIPAHLGKNKKYISLAHPLGNLLLSW